MNNVTKKMLTTLSIVNNALANAQVRVKLGTQACAYIDTRGRKVVEIPALDFRNKANCELAIGNGVHEALHHVFTDFNDYSSCESQFHTGVTNALEDGMIESLGAHHFPGIKDIMMRYLSHGRELGWWTGDDEPERLFIMYVRLYMSVHRQKMQIMQSVLDVYESVLRKTFNGSQLTELNALLDEGKSTVTTTDNRLLALRILEWLNDQQDEQDDANGDSDGDSQQDDANGDSDGDSQQDDANADSGGDSQQDDANADSSGDSQQDDANGDSGGDSQQDDANGDSGSDCKLATSKGRLDFNPFKTADINDKAKEYLEAQPLTKAIDQDLMSAKLASRSTHFDTTDEDYGLKKGVNKVQAKCFKPLSLIVRSRKWADAAISKRGTDIEESRLYRAKSDGKIFKEEAVIKGENAAVSLLLDNSGSMDYEPTYGEGLLYHTAVPSVFGISKALERLKVPNEIFAFSCWQEGPKVFPLKGFKEKCASALSKNGMILPQGGTPTGEAICAAVPSLALRSERKKVMIVITDGESNFTSDVQSAIALANKFDITVEFILIKMSWSEGFDYVHHRTINNIRELPKALEHICENLV